MKNRSCCCLIFITLAALVPAEAQVVSSLETLTNRIEVGDPSVTAADRREGPKAIATADLNGDDRPDLAVANLDGTVTLLFGSGDGGFSAPQHLLTGAEELRAVEASDLNGDGQIDLAIASPTDGKLHLFFNSGGGVFGSPIALEAWTGVRSLAAGDFDGDGTMDLAAAGPGKGLRHFRGTGGGSFEVMADLPQLGPEFYVLPKPVFSMHVIRSLDDTRDDLLVTNAESPVLYVLSTQPADRSNEPPLANPPFAWNEFEPEVLLTEVQIHNEGTLLDEDDEAQPWVELFNRGNAPVSLSGWKLQVGLVEWPMPPISLEPGRFTVMFLSGKNRIGAELHAGITIDGKSPSVSVVNPMGKSHTLNLEEHTVSGISFGLPMGGAEPRWFDLPSPGVSNHAGFKNLSSVRIGGEKTGLTISPNGDGSMLATVRTGETTLTRDKLSTVWFSVVDGIEEKHYPLKRVSAGVYETKLSADSFADGMAHRILGRFRKAEDDDFTYTREIFSGLDDEEDQTIVEPKPGSLMPVASVPSPKVKSFDIGAIATQPGAGALPDLVYADDECGLLRVHRGVATAQRFEMVPSQDLQIRGAPRDVALDDIDGDGWLDATVVLRGLDLALTCRNEAGVLKVVGELATGSSPRAVVLADVNDDELPDAAVINRESEDVSILLTSEALAGLVSSDQIYPVDGEVSRMSVVDWNGDGRDDVIQLHRGSGEVSVRYAEPDGSLTEPEFIVLAGELPSGMASADINGDGVPDTVTANLGRGQGTISTLISQPDGSLQVGPTISGLSGMFAISLADFDGDGEIDIVAGLFDCRISFYRGDGSGSFTYTRTQDFVSESRLMVVDDFDQDGDIDIAGAGYQGTVVVVENPGDLLIDEGTRTFYPPPSNSKFGSERISIFDANGDTDPDLLIGSGAGVMIYLGGAGMNFTFDQVQSESIPDFPVNDVVTLDLDGNGTLEMVVLCQQAACVNIFTRSAPGEPFTLLSQAAIPSGRYLGSGDLDGDGKPDIVCTGDVLWTVLSSRPPEIAAPRSTDSQRATTSGIVINEVLSRNTGTPVAVDAGRKTDFVEFFNSSEEQISMNGWKVQVEGTQDGAPFDQTYTIPDQTVPAKGHVVVLFSDNLLENPDYTGFNLPAERTNFTLKRADDSVADATQTPPALRNVSWARFRDGHPKFHSDPIPSPSMSNLDNGTPDPDVKLAPPTAEKLIAGQPIRFTAKGNDDVGIVSLSLLWKRLDVADETERVVLYDDGQHDDGLTTDGFFAGQLDSGLPAGAEVQFYLEAVDLSGNVTILPEDAELVDAGMRPTAWTVSMEAPPTLEIVEVSVDGNAAYRDESDKKPDYIIVRNTGSEAVDMDGVLLSRSPLSSDASTYAFPSFLTLMPGAEAVVFADEDVEDGPMHAPFELDRGDDLSLLAETASGARRWVSSMKIPDEITIGDRLRRLPDQDQWVTTPDSSRYAPIGDGNSVISYDSEGNASSAASIVTVSGGNYELWATPVALGSDQLLQSFVGSGEEVSFVNDSELHSGIYIVYVPPVPTAPEVSINQGVYLNFLIDAPHSTNVRVYVAHSGLLDGDPDAIPLSYSKNAPLSDGLFRVTHLQPHGGLPFDWRVRVSNSSGVFWTEPTSVTSRPARGGYGPVVLESLDESSATVASFVDQYFNPLENIRVAYGTKDCFFDESEWDHVLPCDRVPGTERWRQELTGLIPGQRYFARFFADQESDVPYGSIQRLEFVAGTDSRELMRWGLRFTEIMYHPLQPSEAEIDAGFVESDFEFLELHNMTDQPMDLSGWYFSTGIDLDFPEFGGPVLEAGGYGIIAANPHAFAMRYSDEIPVLAYTSHPFRESKLSNGGEDLVLTSPDDLINLSVRYYDRRTGDDGDGYTLEPDVNWSWWGSRAPGGTPGYQLPLGRLRFSEWQASNFTSEQVGDESVAGWGSDPDGDGVTNGDEFFFGRDPLVGDARDELRAVGMAEIDGLTYLECTMEYSPYVEPNRIFPQRLTSSGPLFATHRLGNLRWSEDRQKVVRTIFIHQDSYAEAIFRLHSEFD